MPDARSVDIAVWRLRLSPAMSQLPLDRWAAGAGLSEDELAFARGCGHPHARLAFLGGRAAVRHALAHATGLRCGALQISRPRLGKAVVAGPAAATAWHFNLAHSGDEVVCAVADRPLGIDIEPLRHHGRHLAVMQRQFSRAECAWVGPPGPRAERRFSALWTLKEAYAKARGAGLALPMRSIVLRPTGVSRGEARSDGEPGSWHTWLQRLDRHWLALCSAAPPQVSAVRAVPPP